MADQDEQRQSSLIKDKSNVSSPTKRNSVTGNSNNKATSISHSQAAENFLLKVRINSLKNKVRIFVSRSRSSYIDWIPRIKYGATC